MLPKLFGNAKALNSHKRNIGYTLCPSHLFCFQDSIRVLPVFLRNCTLRSGATFYDDGSPHKTMAVRANCMASLGGRRPRTYKFSPLISVAAEWGDRGHPHRNKTHNSLRPLVEGLFGNFGRHRPLGRNPWAWFQFF